MIVRTIKLSENDLLELKLLRELLVKQLGERRSVLGNDFKTRRTDEREGNLEHGIEVIEKIQKQL